MTHKEIISTYREICNLILNRQIKSSFDKLDVLVSSLQNGAWADRKEELETNYKFMLQYTANGVSDPQQESIYASIQLQALDLADCVTDALLERDSSNFVYSQKRIFCINNQPDIESIIKELESFHLNESLADLLQESQIASNEDYCKNHDRLLSGTFNRLWLTSKYKSDETELCRRLFESPSFDVTDKCVLVSAVTLGLMQMFDEAKFNILFKAFADSDALIRQRALVGILLCMYIYQKRLELYPNVTGQFNCILSDKSNIDNVKNTVIQIIRSKETEGLTKKIKEEFIPDMMKVSPIIQEKINLKDLMDESLFVDKNPEWEELFDKNGITDKINQFTELQIEGADVFLGTFSSMKNYPFFYDICNWFLPFKPTHSAVKELFKDKEIENAFMPMMRASLLCNSDKYSLILSLLELPASYKEMMMKSLNMQKGQLEDMAADDKILQKFNNANTITNQYVQDLYRFFRLHSRKKEFSDPFKLSFKFHKLPSFQNIEDRASVIRFWGEFFFSKNFFEEALSVFEELKEEFPLDAELHQKTGYCYQQALEFEKAVECYRQAYLIKPDNIWNLKKIAFCYRKLGDSQNALNAYLDAEHIEPDDLSLQLNIGQCHLELKQYEEALSVFFKIEYLSPNNPKVRRSIALCSFLTGKVEQAKKYYNKIEDKTYNDWINIGHTELCLNNRNEAVNAYAQSMRMLNGNTDKFDEIFSYDKKYLLQNGVNPDELPLLLDKARYGAQN